MGPSSPSILTFDGVTKRFDGKLVIDSFHLTLAKGETVVLLGPSGCGKTTLLHLTTGLLQPDAGHVSAYGLRISSVFQEPRLLPWSTALDNVLFVTPGAIQSKEWESAVYWLNEVGLGRELNTYPHKLSGGMKQRVSIARALYHEPDLLLMDEPFSALDIAIKGELQSTVRKLVSEKQISMLYVTHDIHEAVKMADRIVVLQSSPCRVAKIVDMKEHRRAGGENVSDIVYRQLSTFILKGNDDSHDA